MEQKIYYDSDNNIKLCGILNKTSDDKIVILCHGIRGDKEECGSFTYLARKLQSIGYSSFRFDFYGHGESGGRDCEMTITKEIIDLKSTIKMLKTIEYKEFVILGASFGASIVSLFPYEEYPNIKGIVLWYGALDYEYIRYGNLFSDDNKKHAEKNGFYISRGMNTGNEFKFGLDLFNEVDIYKPCKELERNKLPKLFIHGDMDSAVPYNLSQEVSGKCNNSRLVIIHNGEHTFQNSKEALEQAVNETIKFIENILQV